VAGYEVPVHADIPHQEVIFLDETDPISSPIIRQIVRAQRRYLLIFPGNVVECALDSGQFQAAVLTGCWAWRSSYCAGLR
jgi:hypothetical protein